MTIEELAAAFWEKNDEQQAQFFIALAGIEREQHAVIVAAGGEPDTEVWISVGRHLRDCSCSTEEARKLVRALAVGLASDAKEGT